MYFIRYLSSSLVCLYRYKDWPSRYSFKRINLTLRLWQAAGYWGGKKVCQIEAGAKTKTSPPRQTKGNFFHISRRNPKSLLNAKESIWCKILWVNISLWSDTRRYSKIFQQWKSGPEIYVRRLLKKFYGSRSLIVSSERQIGETFIHCHCTFPLNFWWNLTIREKKLEMKRRIERDGKEI